VNSAIEVEERTTRDKMLRITDTTLRDAHQSLWATRLSTEDIMGIIDVIDSVGYSSLEVWGGATFDVCLRTLRENPWERLRLIKARAKKTPLQMLLRGQNLVGYRNYSDDVVERFVALACENGMDIFRVFDALNDTRNIEFAVRTIKKYGRHAQGTICYTISPVHSIDRFLQYAKEQIDIGIDSLCVKDMAGILSPHVAQELINALVAKLDLSVQVHCHSSSGMAVATYMAAVHAGAEAIDCAISSLAGFSSQPAVETMISIFAKTPFEIRLNIKSIETIESYFNELAPKRRQSYATQAMVDPGILIHQIPGGMISNFRSQLKQQNALDKLDEVLAEVYAVRKDMGYPPLVTPTSQIIGTQAVMNVLAGERYEMVPNEVKNYVKGMYGRPPAPLESSFTNLIVGNEEPITCRPADLIEPMLPAATKSIDPKLIESEEDILSYCILPESALGYFQWRALPPDQRPGIPANVELERTQQTRAAVKANLMDRVRTNPEISPEEMNVFSELIEKAAQLNIHEFTIHKGQLNLTLKLSNEHPFDEKYCPDDPLARETAEREEPEAEKVRDSAGKKTRTTINAPIGGTCYRGLGSGKPPFVNVGDVVNKGDKVCVVEAMKMFNEICAEKKCRIVKILFKDGQTVAKGKPLITIKEL
jgi:oxaloacetate decarboxylase alpha subunit